MTEAEALEREIMEKAQQLATLRQAEAAVEVEDYTFQTPDGEVRLSNLFGGRERLLMIHNMGQGCRYCTLWADGISGVLQHLEDAMAVALTSKDPRPAETGRQTRTDGLQTRGPQAHGMQPVGFFHLLHVAFFNPYLKTSPPCHCPRPIRTLPSSAPSTASIASLPI